MSAARGAGRSPNFLFIVTDQHRADWLGCAGHPVLSTPHIDALAAHGTRFTRFHAASPVCMPNRASLMTGRYPTTHGLRYNGCLLPASAATFVEVLRRTGYRTASIGKSHLAPFTGTPPVGRQPFETGPVDEAWFPDGADYGQEEGDRYEAPGRYAFATPYYGFEHVDMVTEHGDHVGGHYLQWLREQTDDWQRLRDRGRQLPHDYTVPQAYRTALPEELYSTSYIRDRACAWLRERAGDDAPFFAFVSFPDPHHPFTPPGRYWDLYSPDDFDVPLTYDRHRNPPPPLAACVAAARAGIAPRTAQTAFALLDERAIREAMALSAGMLAMIDDAVGTLLATLREAGLDDDTVVCFTADHGEYLGDFNLMLKGAWPLDAINRVPFIWTDPAAGGEARESAALASTVDIAPTVLARAGVRPYFGMQGLDLAACLAGGDRLRDSLLVELNDNMPRMGFEVPARVRTLITDDARLSVYKGHHWGELYLRDDDPHDTHNRWHEAAAGERRAALTLALGHHLIDLMDESPLAQRLA